MPCPGVTRQCALPAAPVRLPSCCALPNARRPMPMLCPVSAGLPAPHSSSRKLCCDALNTLPGTLVGARWTTPFGSSSVPLSLANHVPEPHYCVVQASFGLRTSSPNVLFLPRASPTTIMLVAAHLGSIPRPRHGSSSSSLLPLPPQQASDASHHSSTG
jgi:hypothetical protein